MVSAPAPAEPPEWAAHLPPGVHPDEVVLGAAGSLPSAWVSRWRDDPGRAVLGDATGTWLTGDAVEERTRGLARCLHCAGLEPGDRMVLSARPSLDMALAYIAALRLGLVVVPVNTAYTSREVAHIVRSCRPALAVVDEPQGDVWGRGDLAREVAAVRAVDPTLPLPTCDGSALALDMATAADPAMVCFTSGTTGVPKGVVLTHGNLLASCDALRLAWRWEPDDRLVLALPLFHLHGLGVGLAGTLTAGASVLVQPRFDPAPVLDAAAMPGTSLFFGVPTMYTRLLDAGAGGGDLGALRSLRLCVSGSAPLPAAVHEAFAERTGQAVLERYGMTETVMNVSNPYVGERRPGSVGLPLPGVEVLLADDGELLVRGSNVFGGYLDDEAATAAAFLAGGWFRTGDLGRRDADGHYRLVGRRSELIITGGYNVYPREVEDVLVGLPGVAEAAVVGVADDEWGEVVTAFVVGDVDPPALGEAASTLLARYKVPRRFVRVESLPRNALGKVVKSELVERSRTMRLLGRTPLHESERRAPATGRGS